MTNNESSNSPFLIPNSQFALVLGAGGSARAVVYALAQAGWSVYVAARRVEQAEALAAEIETAFLQIGTSTLENDLAVGRPRSTVIPIPLSQSAISNLKSTISLLVNTTPLGMAPAVDGSPWPAGLPFPPGAVVYDLVYNPLETAFMRAARLAGLPAFNGLGMLVEQAALSFERWTGQPASREAMREAVS